MSTKSDQYHYVYKIIQLSTQREYIGIHSTSDFNDGYMGSGTLIAPAVEENPTDFIKTIIWMGTSREQIEEIEASLVTEEYLLANFPEKTFNQVPGGKINPGAIAKWWRILHPEEAALSSGRSGKYRGQEYCNLDIRILNEKVYVGKRLVLDDTCYTEKAAFAAAARISPNILRALKSNLKAAKSRIKDVKIHGDFENSYYFTGTKDGEKVWLVKSSYKKASPFVVLNPKDYI